MIALLIVN